MTSCINCICEPWYIDSWLQWVDLYLYTPTMSVLRGPYVTLRDGCLPSIFYQSPQSDLPYSPRTRINLMRQRASLIRAQQRTLNPRKNFSCGGLTRFGSLVTRMWSPSSPPPYWAHESGAFLLFCLLLCCRTVKRTERAHRTV